MKVLVIGSGGREHALAWKLASSPHVTEVLVAPGNAGTACEPRCRNVSVTANDVPTLLWLAQHEAVDFTVVGPEAPLALGVVDAFREAGLRIFGPTRAAAQIESSKAFAKDFLARHNIPTAQYRVFTEIQPALAYIASRGAPIVIKADGLAAGKGVVVAQTLVEAQDAVRDMLTGSHGAAGARVVIEDFLAGEETSYIVVAAGDRYVPLATSQDHKRIWDGDCGPNTGGMGAYSPAPVVTPEIEARIRTEVIEPTLAGMIQEGCPFTGFLYAGLMIAPDGTPRVIEFNARMGDPETQPIMMRLESDLYELLDAAVAGDPARSPPVWTSHSALGVVLAAGEYPGEVQMGDVIHGLDAPQAPNSKVFHAGTRLGPGGEALTNGGRVLCVTGVGPTVSQAAQAAYAAITPIQWAGMQYRKDIGHRAIARELDPA